MKTFDNIINFILKKRLFFSITIALLTIASSVLILTNLKIDNSLSIWFLEDNADYKEYIKFQEEQGSNEIIIAMFPVKDAFASENVAMLSQLHTAIDTLSYVTSTFSLANATYPIYGNKKINYKPIYNTQRSRKSLNSLLEKLPVLKQQLVTEDNNHLLFYIQLKPTHKIELIRQKAVSDIKAIIHKKVGEKYYYSGPPVLNEAYNTTVYNESIFFAVLTVIIILVILFFLLPHVNYVVIALLSVIIPVSMVLGLLTVLGYRLNMISMIIPTILTVYSVSDIVHITNFYYKHKKKHPKQAKNEQIKAALQKSLRPCFYTTLTTIIGYLALYFSPLPAFKVMSVFATVGLVLSFILVYIISSIGFYYLPESTERQRERTFFLQKIHLQSYLNKINNVTSRHNKPILIIAILILGLGLYAIPNIKVNTDSLHLLSDGKVKNDLKFIEKKIGGSTWLQLNISSKNGISLLQDSTLLKLEKFQLQLKKNELVSAPVSILNFKTFLEKRSPVLFQSNMNAKTLEGILKDSKKESNTFFSLFSDDFSRMAMTISAKELQTQEIEKLITSVKDDFKTTFNEDEYKLGIQGFSAIFAKLNRFILQTQFRSFTIAFIVSFILLIIFIGNIKLSILALLPNIIPLALLAIIMWVLKMPLDVSTVMIAPIMLGITMDDTIHLLYSYKTNRTKNSSKKRIDAAVLYTGNALLSTTIALVFGFLIIGFSGVKSISSFGLLCAFTIAIALVADIILLPALFKTFVKNS